MKEFWRSKSNLLAVMLICCLCPQNSTFCFSLNDEGVALLRFKEKVVSDPHGALSNWIDEVGVETPCSWFGVWCSDGNVVALNLKDRCLKGTLSLELGNLIHMKSIILRNNSFSGTIPKEITNLKELEILDLGYNNFSGLLPRHLGKNFSLTMVFLDNNELLGITNPGIYELQYLSEVQAEDSSKSMSSSNGRMNLWNWGTTEVMRRKLLQVNSSPLRRGWELLPQSQPRIDNLPSPASAPAPAPSRPTLSLSPSPSPSPSPLAPSPLAPSPSPVSSISPSALSDPTGKTSSPAANPKNHYHQFLKLSPAIGGPIILLLLIVGFFYFKTRKDSTVNPWATGLSGPLRRAFVTGVPKLQRSELEAACEEFSNVIGSSSICTLYKGTLSSGVEIAVASIMHASTKDWSKNLEAQFRNKVDTLSKVNHRNFVSLLGYCEEEKPFTRMMVFEYAPNGTLFEHIHIREAEHLNWEMRLRIAMGIAYCLEQMHQSTPPIVHKNLSSSSVYLTEDYAAKLADFVFWDEGDEAQNEADLPTNICSFGAVVFEMVTGKLPFSAGSSTSIPYWASDYLRGVQSLKDIVDPTLRTYDEGQLELIDGLIKSCLNPDSAQRPVMKEVCLILQDITGIKPEQAIPNTSPLWWAELEILSSEVV